MMTINNKNEKREKAEARLRAVSIFLESPWERSQNK